ncbi:hypothetical protein H6P81_013800 [Aristolochia fimbriata]|uniref:Transmembrane protein n=1 Tax=Aristolochia fimbriata TaxID=158543 RepID=A0AAV7EJB2_ARIFI|nr:hypothetical protein H6P81_013800 [Aristolochia fimbriata]
MLLERALVLHPTLTFSSFLLLRIVSSREQSGSSQQTRQRKAADAFSKFSSSSRNQAGMENHQSWRMRFSFRNATIVVCLFNLVTVVLLLQGFIGGSGRRNSEDGLDSVQQRYIMEAEELRRAMEPLELIKRVREIQEEVYTDPETSEQEKVTRKTAAVDLSKRLQDFRNLNDANSKKALEEWRKRKMERARQREMDKI